MQVYGYMTDCWDCCVGEVVLAVCEQMCGYLLFDSLRHTWLILRRCSMFRGHY